MNLNATLLVQIIFFLAFAFVTLKYIWPIMQKTLDERRREIADGLAEAEKGRKLLEDATISVKEVLARAQEEARLVVAGAREKSSFMVQEARDKAKQEGDKMLDVARGNILKEYGQAKEQLTSSIAEFAILAAQKILERNIDKESNIKIVNNFIEKLSIQKEFK